MSLTKNRNTYSNCYNLELPKLEDIIRSDFKFPPVTETTTEIYRTDPQNIFQKVFFAVST